jgi:hypothetical protein
MCFPDTSSTQALLNTSPRGAYWKQIAHAARVPFRLSSDAAALIPARSGMLTAGAFQLLHPTMRWTACKRGVSANLSWLAPHHCQRSGHEVLPRVVFSTSSAGHRACTGNKLCTLVAPELQRGRLRARDKPYASRGTDLHSARHARTRCLRASPHQHAPHYVRPPRLRGFRRDYRTQLTILARLSFITGFRLAIKLTSHRSSRRASSRLPRDPNDASFLMFS